MLVSFIVPVYNVEKYIEKCLDSILAQSGATFEILLLDDGSKDNSGKICDQYALKYPELIRVIHKENEGLLLTRRRGFKEAKGDYFACVDSDDYINSNYLQTVSEAIRKYGCDLLMFNYESFYPDDHKELSGIDISQVSIFENEGKQQIYERRLLKNKYNNMWSKVIRRDVVDTSLDYSVFGVKNMCEDAIQSYELYSNAKKIVYVPEVLYEYRRDIASITSNVSLDYWYSLKTGYDLGWKYIDNWKISEEVKDKYATRCISFFCDFIRWCFNKTSADDVNDLLESYVKNSESYNQSVSRYRKEYLATRYLKLSVPKIMKLIVENNIEGLRRFFKTERVIRKISGK